LGAGIVGWSVAVQLLDALPNCRLTVVADQLDGETVSWVAAGSFRVENFEELCPDRPGQGRKWAADSFQHYLDLAVSGQGSSAGCLLLPLVQVYEDSNQTPPDYLQLAHSVATLTPDQLRAEFPRWPSLQCGWSCETTLTESRLYLPFLRARFRRRPAGQGSECVPNPWPGVQSSSSLAQTSRDWTEWGDVHLPGSYRHRYSWRLSPTKQLVDRALSRRRLQNLVSSYPTRTVSGRRRNCQSTGRAEAGSTRRDSGRIRFHRLANSALLRPRRQRGGPGLGHRI
ncbi:hypothetical protein BOX15_Mlig008574g2, partial [Macrostomum lignano]